MKDELLALAERVEAVAGPDDDLNKLIHEALGNCVHRETEYYCIEDGNDSDSGFTCKFCHEDMYGVARELPYTASLDAAVTLVPEGWFNYLGERFDGRWEHTLVWKDNGMARVASVCSTPALALTAAALRARAVKWQAAKRVEGKRAVTAIADDMALLERYARGTDRR